ncbi:Hpt domain-containing protein [Nocardioides sp. GXZ039]|uniref:Hpt domain-containing protein n=1 Tax=Nocardioides sp. GXZ039 TaxID=3136018 RepID=UPI0030F39CB3
MTVFDPRTLHQLADDDRARPFLLGLAETFQRMLGERVSRLVDAVRGADVEEAMDAVLSLKVSSTMIGAHELARTATLIEGYLRSDDLPGASSLLLVLAEVARRTDAAIAGYLTHAADALGGAGRVQVSSGSMR